MGCYRDYLSRQSALTPLYTIVECSSRDSDAELEELLAGKQLPYAFTGPPAACTEPGCRHEYWGSRCR